MKDLPSKADMKEAGIALRERAIGEAREGYSAFAVRLRCIADFLENLAAEKETETDEESSFLPCPYCGFRDGVEYEERTDETHYRHWYRCFKCGSRGPRAEARDAAKCRWNTRAILPRTSLSPHDEPKVESLRDAARRLWSRKGPDWGPPTIADLCAVVLRRYRTLLNMFTAHVTGFGDDNLAQRAQDELAETDQMLEGCE